MKFFLICVATLLYPVDGNPAAHFADRMPVGNVTADEQRTLIYPGTRWCGPGDIGNRENNVGEKPETDKCCHAHDTCPDYMTGWSTRHGLWNEAPYTRLHCDCDEAFYRCLQAVDNNSTENTLIGHLYFTVLFTRCFREDYPIVGCKRVVFKRCLEYEQDTTRNKEWQWFDEPFYTTNLAEAGETDDGMLADAEDNQLYSEDMKMKMSQ